MKPMFELGLATPPTDLERLAAAVGGATPGVEASGWSVLGSISSPISGAAGAPELLLHARRAA